MTSNVEPIAVEACWSDDSPAHVIVSIVDGSSRLVAPLPPHCARELAAQLLGAAEAAEDHVGSDLPRGLAHRAAALRAVRDILEAGQRLAVLYGVERTEAKRISTMEGLTARFDSIARARIP